MFNSCFKLQETIGFRDTYWPYAECNETDLLHGASRDIRLNHKINFSVDDLNYIMCDGHATKAEMKITAKQVDETKLTKLISTLSQNRCFCFVVSKIISVILG